MTRNEDEIRFRTVEENSKSWRGMAERVIALCCVIVRGRGRGLGGEDNYQPPGSEEGDGVRCWAGRMVKGMNGCCSGSCTMKTKLPVQ